MYHSEFSLELERLYHNSVVKVIGSVFHMYNLEVSSGLVSGILFLTFSEISLISFGYQEPFLLVS